MLIWWTESTNDIRIAQLLTRQCLGFRWSAIHTHHRIRVAMQSANFHSELLTNETPELLNAIPEISMIFQEDCNCVSGVCLYESDIGAKALNAKSR